MAGPGRSPRRASPCASGHRRQHRQRRHPGFRATSVDFESSLKAAIASGTFDAGPRLELGASTTPTDTPVGANGNNVDLRKEIDCRRSRPSSSTR